MNIVHHLSGAEAITIHEHVLEANFQGVHAQLCSQNIHCALRGPDGLHRSVAPVGSIRRQIRVRTMGIDPDMRNTIRSYRGIAHLLCDPWPAVSICTCIDPAFNSFRN